MHPVRIATALLLGTLTTLALLLWTFGQPLPTPSVRSPWITLGPRDWLFASSRSRAREDLVLIISSAADNSPISPSALQDPSLSPIRYAPWRAALLRSAPSVADRGGTWAFSAFGFPFRAAARGSGPTGLWGQASIWWPNARKPIATHPIWPGLLANIAIAFLLWLLLLPIPGFIRRALRRRRGHCPHCDYDLRHDLSHRCPECGRPGTIITP